MAFLNSVTTQNFWETADTIYRYSLQYGQRLAGLSADISKSEVRNFDSLLKETKKVGQQYMKDFWKHYFFRNWRRSQKPWISWLEQMLAKQTRGSTSGQWWLPSLRMRLNSSLPWSDWLLFMWSLKHFFLQFLRLATNTWLNNQQTLLPVPLLYSIDILTWPYLSVLMWYQNITTKLVLLVNEQCTSWRTFVWISICDTNDLIT